MNAQETVNYLLQLPRESEYFSNDETILKVIPKTAKYPTLKAMQDFVGGRIERVSLSNGDDLIIYEEGLYDDTAVSFGFDFKWGVNLIATKLYHNDIAVGRCLDGMDTVREHMMPPLFGNVIYLEGGLK